jgi:hypothetical protein
MTLFSGGKFYGMTLHDRSVYNKKKAADVDKGIVYTDNEFAPRHCRLAFEMDLKSKVGEGFNESWLEDMINHAGYITKQMGRKYWKATAHLLTRPPYQTEKGIWKYGMHIIFPYIIVTWQQGDKMTRNLKRKISYLDSVYEGGDIARLRPAFSRKVERSNGESYWDNGMVTVPQETQLVTLKILPKGKKRTKPKQRFKKILTLAYFYDYHKSLKCNNGKIKLYVHGFRDTYHMLMQTALSPPKDLPLSKNK